MALKSTRRSEQRREKLLELCAALPEAVAVPMGQHFAFKVRNKNFAWYVFDHHGDGRVAVHCKSSRELQQELVARDPERYFVPPFLGARGWIGLYLDTPKLDWDDVLEVMASAYRRTAPAKLVAKLD
jgi:hypothetical protein